MSFLVHISWYAINKMKNKHSRKGVEERTEMMTPCLSNSAAKHSRVDLKPAPGDLSMKSTGPPINMKQNLHLSIEPRLIQKKAWRTFEMFSSTDWQGFRSCCHHTPRHLAWDCVFMAVPATSMVAGVKGVFYWHSVWESWRHKRHLCSHLEHVWHYWSC